MCMVCFREDALVVILDANSKRYFWAVWTVLKDCQSHFGWQCAGRERDPSGCRASGLLPVHVVGPTGPPLLVLPSWPAVVVTNKRWITAL